MDSESHGVEINCAACGSETLLIREPVYEGFSRVGELLKCSNCGYTYESEEEVVFRKREKIAVFDESDRSEKVEVFGADEMHVVCRYCRHYVVNPFTQWCHRNRKEVEATDTCGFFERQEEPENGGIEL